MKKELYTFIVENVKVFKLLPSLHLNPKKYKKVKLANGCNLALSIISF